MPAALGDGDGLPNGARRHRRALLINNSSGNRHQSIKRLTASTFLTCTPPGAFCSAIVVRHGNRHDNHQRPHGSTADHLGAPHRHRGPVLRYFFELADLNTFAFAAPGVIKDWGDPGQLGRAHHLGQLRRHVSRRRLRRPLRRRVRPKRGFVISILIYALFSVLNALSWNVITLALFRFLTGVGLSAMTIIANTYVSEFFPAHVRGKYMGRIVTIGLVGIPATAFVARWLVPLATWGWRLVFIWGGLGIFALVFAVRMKESPRWHLNRNEGARASAICEELEIARYGRARFASAAGLDGGATDQF